MSHFAMMSSRLALRSAAAALAGLAAVACTSLRSDAALERLQTPAPLALVANEGQWPDHVRFAAPSGALWLEDGAIVGGYDFVLRMRWNTALTRRFEPIAWGEPFVSVAHEILLNAYSDDDRGTVDQSRVSLLFGLDLGSVTIRTGYMNRYFPNARGGDGLVEHGAILWFTHSVDLEERRRTRRPEKYDYDDYPEYGGP